MPYPRNPLFTERELQLDEITRALQSRKRAAFSGMGGIGKTQTALEYVYRHRDEYDYVFWVRAELEEEIILGYFRIAEALQIPGRQQPNQIAVLNPVELMPTVNLVKRWLATHDSWLLVIDNADEIRMVQGFLPSGDKGHILLTTRAQALGTVAQRVEMAKMVPDEGALFLLRRAKLIQPDDSLTNAGEADQGLAHTLNTEMDGLPLALDQAGAYIEERFLSLEDYLELFREEKAELLQKRGELASDHPSVTVTFSLAFKKVADRSTTAADLIRVCAFLSPDDISEEIFIAGASELGENLSPIAESKRILTDAIANAARYSLVHRNAKNRTLNIHRLVQEVLKAMMDEAERTKWTDRVVRAIISHVLSIINKQRTQAGLLGLRLHSRLTAAAQAHSKDMAWCNFLSHIGSDGSSFAERIRRHGYSFSASGENVAFGFTSAQQVVQGWMNSPGHRANILNPKYKDIGIGYAHKHNDYWTLIFGAPL